MNTIIFETGVTAAKMIAEFVRQGLAFTVQQRGEFLHITITGT